MVALNSFRLEYIPKPCLAKPMLFAALACHDKGDVIGAGVRLREAVTRFLRHACDYYGCMPKGKFPRPRDFASALHNAKHLDKWGYGIMLDIIDAGNKAAHCQKVDACHVSSGIALLFSMMDGEPYAGHERQPLVTSHKASSGDDDYYRDDDDYDSADWWKEGDV